MIRFPRIEEHNREAAGPEVACKSLEKECLSRPPRSVNINDVCLLPPELPFKFQLTDEKLQKHFRFWSAINFIVAPYLVCSKCVFSQVGTQELRF